MNQVLEQAGEAAERRCVEAVVETLANLRDPSETLAAVAHDARNMVTALGLYCDLLEEPGVLATPYAHYGSELRLVAAASRRLVEKLVVLDTQAGLPPEAGDAPAIRRSGSEARGATRRGRVSRWETLPAAPIGNLAEELLANRSLLAALAGPAIAVTVDAEGGASPVRMTAEDLTRILVNLVKNAAEAMPSGGRIQISLRELPAEAGAEGWLSLSIEDSGPGIPQDALGKVFDSGYTAHGRGAAPNGGWPATHRGLGLAITRSIVEAAGGRIFASNRAGRAGCGVSGARFEIELPVR